MASLTQHQALFLGGAAGDLADDGVLADLLGDDVARAGQRLLDRRHLGVEEALGQLFQRHAHLLRRHQLSQRLQPTLAGHRGAGAALGPVGQVEVLDLLQGGRALDAGPQLRCQLALLVDGGQHGLLALVQVAQVAQPRLHQAQLHLVQPAGGLLAVAGDEGNGVAGVQQLDRAGHLVRLQAQFLGDGCGKKMGIAIEPFGSQGCARMRGWFMATDRHRATIGVPILSPWGQLLAKSLDRPASRC